MLLSIEELEEKIIKKISEITNFSESEIELIECEKIDNFDFNYFKFIYNNTEYLLNNDILTAL